MMRRKEMMRDVILIMRRTGTKGVTRILQLLLRMMWIEEMRITLEMFMLMNNM
jgi:hypothetical protein